MQLIVFIIVFWPFLSCALFYFLLTSRVLFFIWLELFYIFVVILVSFWFVSFFIRSRSRDQHGADSRPRTSRRRRPTDVQVDFTRIGWCGVWFWTQRRQNFSSSIAAYCGLRKWMTTRICNIYFNLFLPPFWCYWTFEKILNFFRFFVERDPTLVMQHFSRWRRG